MPLLQIIGYDVAQVSSHKHTYRADLKQNKLDITENNEHIVNLNRNDFFIFIAICFKAENKCCLPLILSFHILQIFCLLL